MRTAAVRPSLACSTSVPATVPRPPAGLSVGEPGFKVRPLQIFVSYARNDDLPPLESSDAKGFVTALYGHLNYQFKALGPPMPVLWRDTRSIGRSDQFDPIIEGAIGDSALFLVILSRNWLSREFCRKELELFKLRWAKEGEAGIKRRIVVVAKQHIEFEDRPALLQGQEGYWFYRRDADEGVGIEQEFFSGGKPQGEYYDLVKRLAVDLWRRAQSETPPVPGKGGGSAEKGTKADDARTVYLAKPAADMRSAYLRLVDELEQRGYRVVPERGTEIPYDGSAPAFVRSELAKAEASIHVLGEKAGYTPEDSEPIVKLQLQLAAERVSKSDAVAAGGVPFRRIVWAPRVIVDEQGAASAVERDPLVVLSRFDKQAESDKIEGSELSKFAEFVIQHLDRTAPLPPAPPPLGETDARRLYVYYHPDDRKLATDFGKLLQEHEIEPVWPAFQGDPAQIRSYHREKLQECDAVVLCWGSAADLWVKASAHELRNWRELGREKRFDLRGLLAGPPPGEFKDVLMELPPRSEIAVVLDLTKDEELTTAGVEPLIKRTRGASPPAAEA